MSCELTVTTDIPSEQQFFLCGESGQYMNVFGTHVVAEASIPENFVRHAGCIMQGYLDNDNDGSCDDSLVCSKMVENSATLLIQASDSKFKDLVRKVQTPFVRRMVIEQHLFQFEIVPDSCTFESNRDVSCDNQFDATVEEVLHLITTAGVAFAYPDDFGESFDSTVGRLLEDLNGDCGWGYTFDWTNPSSTACTGFYAYNDWTCGQRCLVAEGIYWALTSLLGAQDYSPRREDIDNEWLLYSADEMETNAPELTALLRNKDDFPWLPTSLPETTHTNRRLVSERSEKDVVSVNETRNTTSMISWVGYLGLALICVSVIYRRSK